MSEELKPCPFCGGKAILILHGGHHAFCTGCSAKGINLIDRAKAIAAWNRRATPPAASAGDEVERLRVLTPPMREALGLMMWNTGPIAHAYRVAGHAIPKKAEEEQAFVLHRCFLAAVEHGDQWRDAMGKELEAMRRAREAALAADASRDGGR